MIFRLQDGYLIFLLNDEEIADQIEQYIQIYFTENDTTDVTPQVLWDAAKPVIRG